MPLILVTAFPCSGFPLSKECASRLHEERKGRWPFFFELQRPDGVILATSNALHVEHALACIDAHMAALIEKPLAHHDDVDPVRTIRRAVILEVR